MSAFSNLSRSELSTLADQLSERYAELKARGLTLDMTRGKPCAEQLDLSRALLALPGEGDFKASDGSDTRNYGGLDGLPEMKAIFAELFEVDANQVVVGGNSSLQMMHDSVVRALLHGVPGGSAPWLRQGPIRFLCPTPGYDRHFSVCEHHGIEMISIGMNDE
jgi:DNA-binding transcriptional MocR family regulator